MSTLWNSDFQLDDKLCINLGHVNILYIVSTLYQQIVMCIVKRYYNNAWSLWINEPDIMTSNSGDFPPPTGPHHSNTAMHSFLLMVLSYKVWAIKI